MYRASIVLLCIITLFITGLWAADKGDSSIVLQVVTEEWRPYSYEENGVVKGIATDIVKQLLERTGIKYTIKVYPWARSYSMVQENSNVLIFAMVRTAEREPHFQWIGKVAPADSVFLFKLSQREDLSVTTLEEAKKHRIGVTRDSDMHQFLVADSFPNISVVSKLDLSVKQLLAKRIEFLCDSREGVGETLKNLNKDSAAEIDESLFLYELVPYLAANKELSEEVVLRLQIAYEELLEEGLFEESLH